MYRRETPWDIVKPLLFFLGSILWLEGIYRAFYVRPFFDVGLVYICFSPCRWPGCVPF